MRKRKASDSLVFSGRLFFKECDLSKIFCGCADATEKCRVHYFRKKLYFTEIWMESWCRWMKLVTWTVRIWGLSLHCSLHRRLSGGKSTTSSRTERWLSCRSKSSPCNTKEVSCFERLFWKPFLELLKNAVCDKLLERLPDAVHDRSLQMAKKKLTKPKTQWKGRCVVEKCDSIDC